jgi:hypothetical protein
MPLLKDNSVIHLSTAADLTGFTYTQVYAGAGATVTINGTSVTMAAGSTIDVRVKTITGAASVYVIGSPINVLKQDPNLGSQSV